VSYRSRAEIDEVRATRDCIDNVKNKLLKTGWATEADFKVLTNLLACLPLDSLPAMR